MSNIKGLYIHIPFCVSKCRYCDFVSFPNCKDKYDKYLNALIKEMETYKGECINTVFIGGGTPSVLSADELNRLFSAINENFNIIKNSEFSMEVNPATLNKEKINAMLLGGINRVSVGVQSFVDDELKALGRIHSSADAINTVNELYNLGIKNINVDIMCAIPNQNKDSLKITLKTAMNLPITHISVYSLILEEGTPLYCDYKNGKFIPLNEDDDRALFDVVLKETEKNEFLRYEISNFSKQGYECVHNIKYWDCDEYIGVGLNAHSYINNKRFFNTSHLEKYISLEFNERETEILSEKDRISEFMFMGLRKTKGVGEEEFKRRFKCDIKSLFKNETEKFLNLNLMEYKDGFYRLTKNGLDVSNSIMCEFIL